MRNQKLLGKRIKEIRNKRGYTQEKLAEIIGLEAGSLSSIESGRNFPSLMNLEKMSYALNVELRNFFEFGHLDDIKKVKAELAGIIDELGEEETRALYKYTRAFVL